MQMVIILNAQKVSAINVLLHMLIMWNSNIHPPVLLLSMTMNIIGKHSVTAYKIVFNKFKELRHSCVFQNKYILSNLESVLSLLFELTCSIVPD